MSKDEFKSRFIDEKRALRRLLPDIPKKRIENLAAMFVSAKEAARLEATYNRTQRNRRRRKRGR